MEPVPRISAKVLLVDPRGRVLMLCGLDRASPDTPPQWFPVGGAVEEGETLEAAAIRETAEETGMRIGHPGQPIFVRTLRWTFEGTTFDQHETYFLVRTPAGAAVDGGGRTDLERATLVGHRWWTLDELRTTDEVVWPEDLAARLAPLL